MIKFTNKADKAHTITVIFALLSDIAFIIILSLVAVNFDFSEVLKLSFWANVATMQIITLIAYFSSMSYGLNAENNADDVVALVKDVNSKFEQIDKLYLHNEFEYFLDTINLSKRCDWFINDANLRIAKLSKDADKNKAKINELKEKKLKCYAWKDYYNFLNNPSLTPVEKPNNDFDVMLETTRYNDYINKSQFESDGDKRLEHEELGSYSKGGKIQGKFLAIAGSLAFTILLNAFDPSKKNEVLAVIFSIVWRLTMMFMNVYTGLNAGKSVIRQGKMRAYTEKKTVLSNFMNKMLVDGRVASKKESIKEQPL